MENIYNTQNKGSVQTIWKDQTIHEDPHSTRTWMRTSPNKYRWLIGTEDYWTFLPILTNIEKTNNIQYGWECE